MLFSKACEYGIRAIIYIALQSKNGRRVSLKEIAKAINSPVAFTAKILQQLVRNHLIDSVKGPAGGFEMQAEQTTRVKFIHVVLALDGDNAYTGCGLGLPQCDENRPCPVHDQLVRIRDQLKEMLEQTTIDELTKGLGEGVTHLAPYSTPVNSE